MQIRHRLLLVSLLAATAASAQRGGGRGDTVLKGSTIEVVQTYKPKVKQSPKPQWKPQLPPLDTSHSNLSFEVPQQTIYYAYNSQPLRPLALGKRLGDVPYPNYVKLGAGNLSTIYLDAGIGGIYGENYETGLHLHHLSQKGTIENQKSSLTGLEAEGLLHNDAGDWHGAISASRNRYYNYGYSHILYHYNEEDVRQTFTSVKLAADLKSKKTKDTKLSYQPSLSGSYYAARNNTSEISIGFNAPLTYHINENLGLHLGVSGALTSYKPDTITIANNYLIAAPGVVLDIKDFSGHALLGLGLGKDQNSYLLPDLLLNFDLPNISMKVSGGWHATLRQNSYEQLTTENPFLISTYRVLQTKRDEVFLHVSGSGGDHFSYSGKLSWWNYNDMATYINDSGDQKEFYISYQNVQAISGQISARYHVAGHWSAGITGELYNFYNSTDQFVWHEPTTRVKGDFAYNVTPKLSLSTNIYVLGGIRARTAAFDAVKLNTIIDMGINGEYLVIPRLSVFMQINNLFNSKYERWLGYQAYGFNIYGGLRLKF